MTTDEFRRLTNKKDIVNAISENQNVAIPIDIRQKFEEGKISKQDLEDAGIPDDIIPHIFSYSAPDIESIQDTNPAEIKESGILEAYFWGLATSGKTCALAGILHSIQNKGIKGVAFESADIPYNDAYLASLKDKIIKSNGIAYFPERTPDEKIKYMSFKLLQEVEKKKRNLFSKDYVSIQETQKRKIAFIDLSGEMIRNIVDNDIRNERKNIDAISILKKLLNNGNNRKIHFFFIDYDHDNDKLNQISYLERLISIFNKEKYFTKTDFIYIAITKSDLFCRNGNSIPKNQRREFARRLFLDNYYNLKLNLLSVCTDRRNGGINMDKAGQVILDNYILDYSMGDVYFNRICKFNPESAREIIKILVQKINSTDDFYS